MTEKYIGRIQRFVNYEDHETIKLSTKEEPLSEIIEEDIRLYGKYLSVSYFVSDKYIQEDQVVTEWLNTINGIGNAEYNMRYSEITGYLFTDEELIVGGHDLLEELESFIDKWIYLEIKYSKKPLTSKLE